MPDSRSVIHYTSGDVERVRELLDLTSRMARVGVYELDLINQSLFWSDVTREIHEVSDDFEPQLETAIDFYHEQDRPIIQSAVQNAIQNGEPFDEQLRILTAKGNTCWVRAIGTPEVVDGQCVRLYGTFHDISQHKMVQHAMTEQRQYTESILKAIPDLIFVFSLEGVYLEFRSGARAELITTPDDFLGRHCSEILPADVSEKLMEAIRLTATGIIPAPFEYEIKVNGNYNFYEARLSPLTADKVLAVVRNVTAQRRIQLQLEHNRKVLQETSRIARVGGWEIDLEHKRIFLTEVGREIHEMGEDYVEPQDFEELLSERINYYKEGPDRDRVTTALKKANQTDTGFDEEVRIVSVRGREIWVRVIGTPEYKDGICVRIHGSIHDIDSLKLAQQELERVLEFTRNQNDRLQQFAYMVSHNLRSHAYNVTSMVDFLIADYPRLTQSELGKNLIEMTASLSETIENLTEIAKMNTSGAQRLEEVDLSHTIRAALHTLNAQVREHQVTLQNDIAEGLQVMGIPAYMDSIVLNLITNAIRYKSPERPSVIRLFMTREGKYDVFHVQDNGHGIDLNRHGKKLFGMYKTFHNHPESRGIGLFMTKNQIEVMGGKIAVQSTPNVGTTFSVYFIATESDPTGT